MDIRRRFLSPEIGGGRVDCSEQITFYVTDSYTDITTSYIANGCMTWEEWIDSDYNPYLPNGIDKRFGKQSDNGQFSGNVWYHLWDPDYMQIDTSSEIVDWSIKSATSLNSRIKDKITYCG